MHDHKQHKGDTHFDGIVLKKFKFLLRSLAGGIHGNEEYIFVNFLNAMLGDGVELKKLGKSCETNDRSIK